MKRRIIYANFMFVLILFSSFSIINSTTITVTQAGSPSSGEYPPPGGSDTSGGSSAGGLYMNYRIPVVFRSGPFGSTLISITTFYDGTPIILGFDSIEHEQTTYLNANETMILDSAVETNLKNGSLIQAFAPLQINVYHPSASNTSDDTYSYSPLVMSMWGKSYKSPYDNMKAMIVAGFNLTEVTVIRSGEDDEYIDLLAVGDTEEIDVSNGTVIEGNGPIGVAFYSLSLTEGTFAYTAIPYFLWGTLYYAYPPPETDSIPLIQGETELTIAGAGDIGDVIASGIYGGSVIVSPPDDGVSTIPNSYLGPSEYYENVSSFTNISLTVLYNYAINGTPHKSGLQYIAMENMEYGEFFLTTLFYKNSELGGIVLSDWSQIIPVYSAINGSLIYDIDNYRESGLGSIITYYSNNTVGFIGNGTFFTQQLTSPPETANWNSSANILYPLNIFSYFANYDSNSTDFLSWYRFPNLNVKEFSVSPENPTEFRRLQIDFTVQNNGTILSAPFWVTMYVNNTLKINQQIESLDINETFPMLYEEFQSFGLRNWNISIFIDSVSQIFELYEFDNALQFFVSISRNWNVIFTGVAILVGIVILGIFFLGRRFRKRRRRRKTRFDVILSDIEV